ncbi:DUF4261 domain-containing protein [Roseimicrobium sp. ORNL1]|uniref:DUF4261 domain-containing protein n=1 Tax=Roseimicrobium sp. ORNL1 TaxID=2711231 RepID=UPI0013E0FC6E|nr:DUF4261 domain-containing protein [Roseimicrobium sp. ORNL1]QIF00936.1 DUF4261 domain-containing protein [Roseimicrobium sp. ORNL1]
MNLEMVLCIPGPWADRKEFLQRVVAFEPKGRYLWAGMVLRDTKTQEQVPLEFCDADARMTESFKVAGQGKVPAETLDRIREHRSVVYLHFPLDLPDQLERVLKYSALLRDMGGIAVKVESCGKAHDWEPWFSLLTGSSFQKYTAVITLVADADHYYSCGMHHFGLPDSEVSRALPLTDAAHLMNVFNHFLLVDEPTLDTGHTFGIDDGAPRYRLTHHQDERHVPEGDDLFWNPYGVWRLDAV